MCDKSLIVVAADHGVAFPKRTRAAPPDARRTPRRSRPSRC